MPSLRLKHGTSDPSASDFSDTAELLVNTTDGGLFTKDDSNNVVEIGTVDISGKADLSGDTFTGLIKSTGTRAGILETTDDANINLYTLNTTDDAGKGTSIAFFNHDGSGEELGATLQVYKENGTADDTAAAMRFNVRAAGGRNPTNTVLTLGSDKSATFAGDITAPTFVKSGGTSSQYLMADGSVSTGGGSSTLTGLTDVTLGTLSNGQVLKYNGSAWVNDTDATGGGGSSSTAAYVGARVSFSTGTPTSTNTWYYVSSSNISTVNLDTNSFYNSSNGRYEIPAGVTKIRLRVNLYSDSGTGTPSNIWALYKNGSQITLGNGGFYAEVETSGYEDVGSSNVSGAISVSEGDYFQLAYKVNATTRSFAGTLQIEVVEGSLLGGGGGSTDLLEIMLFT